MGEFIPPISPIETTTEELRQILLGNLYSAQHSNGALADTGTIELVFTSVNDLTLDTFLSLSVFVGGNTTLELFIGPAFSSGTPITFLNRNSKSGNSAGAALVLDPTITDDGTQIGSTITVAGGTKQNPIGAGFGSPSAFIATDDTSYLVRLTNVSGGTTVVNADVLIAERPI